MDHPYFPILIILAVAFVFAGIFIVLSSLIGPRKKFHSSAKFSPYECGLNPVGDAREPVDVKFSLVAMLFIIFDIEAVFLFPWAILFKDFIETGQGLIMLIEMGIFLFILAIGLIYVWRKGALEWR